MGAVKYERIVEEDLNIGTGTVDVTMPGGGTAVGHKIGIQSFPALAVIASMDGGQAVTPSVVTVVALDSEEVDPVSWFDPVTHKFTPTVQGRFQVDAFLQMALFTGVATVAIYVNSSQVVASEMVRAGAAGKVTVSALLNLAAGDEVTLRVSHNDAGLVNVDAARLSAFMVGKVVE